MAFPTAQPAPQFFTQTIHRVQEISPYESGAAQSRPVATKSRMKFTTGWDALIETDLQALYTHFDAYVGTSWSWIHPTTGTGYNVRYTENQLPEAQYVGQVNGVNAWSVGPIALEEI